MRSPYIPPCRSLRLLILFVLSIVATFLGSCSWSGHSLESRFNDRDDVSVSYQQLRLMMRAMVDPMSGQIELSANQIIQTNSDPGIQRAAIEWKAQGVPALRESLFQPAPMTALFDTWVLLNQMETYYATGDGAKALKSAAPSAVATIRRMEEKYNRIIADLTTSGDVSEGRAFAKTWASEHPIQGSLSFRESTLTRAGEIDLPKGFSATGAIADINYTVDDLNRRLEIYSDQAIRQAHWEAELLTMDLTSKLQLDQAIPLADEAITHVGTLSGSVGDIADSVADLSTSVGSIVPIVDRLAKVAEDTPQIIAAERSVAIKAAQDEITRTISTLANERSIALEHITNERIAALETLQAAISAERQLMTEQVEEISTRVVDHAINRIILLIVGIIVAGVLVLLVGLQLVRRMISGLIAEKLKGATPA